MSAGFIAANDEAISLGTGLNLPGTNDELTIDAWVRPIAPFSDSRIFDKSQDLSTTRYLIGMANAGGRIRFDLNGTTLSVGGSNFTGSVWQHILARYDGVDMELWLDGVFDISTAKAGNVSSSADPARIGSAAADSTTRNWLGDIGRLRIFNRALTTSEIESIPPANGMDIITDDLFYEFKLTEGADNVDIGNSVIVNSGPQSLANGSGEGSILNLPTWKSMDLQIYQPAA